MHLCNGISRCWLFILIAICTMIFFISGFFWNKTLISGDKLRKTDALVFLMGGGEDRLDFLTCVVNSGFSDRILIVNLVDVNNNELNIHGVPLNRLASIEVKKMIARGVDSSRIYILNGPSGNTVGEAKRVADFLNYDSSIKSLCVITSSTHTKRADKIFEDVLRKNHLSIKVFTPDNPYTLKYLNGKVSFSNVYLEQIKWIYYLFFKQWLI